jgi:hypothetical protein
LAVSQEFDDQYFNKKQFYTAWSLYKNKLEMNVSIIQNVDFDQLATANNTL